MERLAVYDEKYAAAREKLIPKAMNEASRICGKGREDDEDGGHITWTRAFMESMDKLARDTGLVK